MSKYAKNIVAQAQAWLGYKESNGTHRKIIDVYNSHKPLARGYKVKYTDAWCATFVSAVAINLGYTDIIPTECSCPKMIELFKVLGCWVEDESRTPAPGDIIFYDWQDSGVGDNKGNSDHVGIVEKVLGTAITIIEGNKNNAVERRSLKVNARYIRGYGVPKYDKEIPVSPAPAKKSLDAVAKEVADGKWGNGATRTKKLAAAGYTESEIKTIQSKVNKLVAKNNVTTKSVKVGSKVKVKKGAKSYEGKVVDSYIYKKVYRVDELKGKRAVLDVKGICTAFHVDNLIVQ